VPDEIDFEVWKSARIYDAFVNGCDPQPGDGVLLAQHTTQYLDSLLSRYAARFLSASLKDADFVVGEFECYLKSSATPSDALNSRYVTIVLEPV
jgi:hypothetical protein